MLGAISSSATEQNLNNTRTGMRIKRMLKRSETNHTTQPHPSSSSHLYEVTSARVPSASLMDKDNMYNVGANVPFIKSYLSFVPPHQNQRVVSGSFLTERMK